MLRYSGHKRELNQHRIKVNLSKYVTQDAVVNLSGIDTHTEGVIQMHYIIIDTMRFSDPEAATIELAEICGSDINYAATYIDIRIYSYLLVSVFLDSESKRKEYDEYHAKLNNSSGEVAIQKLVFDFEMLNASVLIDKAAIDRLSEGVERLKKQKEDFLKVQINYWRQTVMCN
jgi:hypothetical protein